MPTAFEKRTHEAQMREHYRARGICVSCRKSPVARNQDGSWSVKCTGCKRVNATPGLYGKNYDGVEEKCSLDSKEYKTYCSDVLTAIKRGARTVGDIKRAIGDDRRLADALSTLAIGEIRCVRDIAPRQFEAVK